MKKHIYTLMGLFLSLFLYSCSDDDKGPGNPVMTIESDAVELENVMFGDSLSFNIGVADADNVPLSTLKARLFFSDEMVSETVIRTKTYDEYEGKIYIPFLKDIPNGTATLVFVLQNINLGITEQEFELPLTRPEYPYLTLVTADKEYKLLPTTNYEYVAEESFPSKVPGYIKTPTLTDRGNVMTFGWDADQVKEETTRPIPFSNSSAGEYKISFNTLTYNAAPFIIGYTINGEPMNRADENNFSIDLNLEPGNEVVVDGIDGFDTWWIDQDFFSKEEDKLIFKPIEGEYRITANFELEYLRVEVLDNGELATLQPDGSGAIWIIGDNIGKPSLANTTGWNPGNAVCMAPIEKGKYRVTLVAGENVSEDSINFKFYYQKEWGSEFGSDALSTDSDLVFVGNGDNGRDSGNLGIIEDKSLTVGSTYQFTVDVTAGLDKVVLTVKEI